MEYAVGKGWHPLVDEATNRLSKLGVKVTSHFEKYGTLQFTVEPEPLEAISILNEIEDRSQQICEMCGATGPEVNEVEFSSWVKTLCPTCFKYWKEHSSRTVIEQYMDMHQFLDADKKKVRDFLKVNQATSAYLTKTELHFTDQNGTPGVIGRGLLGIQDNFN